MNAGKVRRTQLQKFTRVEHIYSGLGLQEQCPLKANMEDGMRLSEFLGRK